MKVVFDTDKGIVKVGSKTFGIDMPAQKEESIINHFRDFIKDNSKMNMYEADSMWMSYRYCIGRHTIAAHQRADDIAKHCYNRMNAERSAFTAYDINNEIEHQMMFGCGPQWYFPASPYNLIYTTAIDIFCQFVEDFNIQTKDDLLKYKEIHVILADNVRGYKLEVTTWEEWLAPQVQKLYNEWLTPWSKKLNITEQEAWELVKKCQENKLDDDLSVYIKIKLKELCKDMPNKEYFNMMNVEDLFVWNDLVHLFDIEHHHKSLLKDGTECEWYWTYTNDYEQREDGQYYRKEIGYRKIRVPVDAPLGTMVTWIPDESIERDLY